MKRQPSEWKKIITNETTDKELISKIYKEVIRPIPEKCTAFWNIFESVLMKWMNLEPIIQGEISQKEIDRSYIIAYICNLERWY